MIGTAKGHVITKALALAAFVRGRRRQARILWRWMANRPTAADVAGAKRRLSEPDMQAALAAARATPAGGTEP